MQLLFRSPFSLMGKNTSGNTCHCSDQVHTCKPCHIWDKQDICLLLTFPTHKNVNTYIHTYFRPI